VTGAPVIAIVDDDPSVRRALHRLIQSSGYTVQTFTSAPEFLDSLPRGRPACLVLDIQMDGMSGFDLQDRLLATDGKVPIVFITGHDDGPTRERLGRSGAAGHLLKPLDEQALLDAIRRVQGDNPSWTEAMRPSPSAKLGPKDPVSGQRQSP
jgi:FixJ family two-component response regulator